MAAMTEHDRRRSMGQALANTHIEGHIPSAEFLSDCERFIRGEITTEDVRAASLERALATEYGTSRAKVRDAA